METKESDTRSSMAAYFAKLIKRTEEDVRTFARDFQEPIREAFEAAQKAVKIYEQYRETIQQALETYRRYAEQIRRMAKRFAQFYQSLNIPKAIREATQFGERLLVSLLLSLFNRLRRPRDATDEEILALTSDEYPIEYRRFRRAKHLPDSRKARLQFVAELMRIAEQVESKYPLNENQLLVTLRQFFEKLFYAIRDYIRHLNRSHQEDIANRQAPWQSTIEVDGKRYLLIPSLSIHSSVSPATLRRYARKGLFDAVKLPYTSERSGHTNLAWHFPYTPQLLDQIRDHAGKKKSLHEILYSRQEVASILGIHVDTLRNWERKGFITSIRKAGKAFYEQSELPKCKNLLERFNKPRFSVLMARA